MSTSEIQYVSSQHNTHRRSSRILRAFQLGWDQLARTRSTFCQHHLANATPWCRIRPSWVSAWKWKINDKICELNSFFSRDDISRYRWDNERKILVVTDNRATLYNHFIIIRVIWELNTILLRQRVGNKLVWNLWNAHFSNDSRYESLKSVLWRMQHTKRPNAIRVEFFLCLKLMMFTYRTSDHSESISVHSCVHFFCTTF